MNSAVIEIRFGDSKENERNHRMRKVKTPSIWSKSPPTNLSQKRKFWICSNSKCKNTRTHKESQLKNIREILEMHSDTPLRQEKHAELLNKLQKYDLEKIDENELEEILPLVLKATNKSQEINEKSYESEENYNCERCKHKNKKKINLTKHLKKKTNNVKYGMKKWKKHTNFVRKTHVITSLKKTKTLNITEHTSAA